MKVFKADLSNETQATAIVDMIAELAESTDGRRERMTAEERGRLVPALRAYPAALVLLAEADGELCGVAVCFLQLSTFSARSMLKIHDLFVTRSKRNRGVGRALVAAAIGIAGEHRCAFVNVEVALENTAAVRLYEGMQFVDWMTPTKFMELRLP